MARITSYSETELDKKVEDAFKNPRTWSKGISDDLLAQSIRAANNTPYPPCLLAYFISLGKTALGLLKTALKQAILQLDAQITALEFVKAMIEGTLQVLEAVSFDYSKYLELFDVSFLFEGVLDILQACDAANGLASILNSLSTFEIDENLRLELEKIENLRRELSNVSKQVTEFIDRKDYLNDILQAIDTISIGPIS